MSYICLRCVSSYRTNSNYEFDLWKWTQINSLFEQDSNLFKLISSEELKIGTLFWWDYYHLPTWIKHSQELLNFGPRNVLSDLRANTFQIFSSDILFAMALGENQTEEYEKTHRFYRAAHGQRLHDLRIQGAPYITQDDDSHFNGLLGIQY